jgi:hypothetical protein
MGGAKDVARVVGLWMPGAVPPGDFINQRSQCLFALYAKMPFDAGLSGVSWDNPQEDFHGAEV